MNKIYQLEVNMYLWLWLYFGNKFVMVDFVKYNYKIR